ncbi:MAG: hypothetical protein IJZ80_07575 [Clostridia bacterium]|nr:hypothetical protein [Clostridia bacterium]
MMKKNYQSPTLGIFVLDNADVLTESIPTTVELNDKDNQVGALDIFFN